VLTPAGTRWSLAFGPIFTPQFLGQTITPNSRRRITPVVITIIVKELINGSEEA